MIRIEKDNWIPRLFARVNQLCDILLEPRTDLESLTKEQRDKFRNTQGLPGDTVRVLGHHGDFALAMKIDGSKGWVQSRFIDDDELLNDFVRPVSRKMMPLEFLELCRGTPYLWGGLSKSGIDCSGLTQSYFFEVHDRIIPRNSREQRAVSPEKELGDARDHDLVFGTGKRTGSHHVGVFLNGGIWHSYTAEGVTFHSVERFAELFNIEAVVTIYRTI